jgi:transcriptional regulator with GAF, ATPase, and Fis domain
VLQEEEVERVGARNYSVDVRIATTHRPLEEMVRSGEFRETFITD